MSNLLYPNDIPGLEFPVVRKPFWSNTIQTAHSGKETRISNWSYPRISWELNYELLRSDSGFDEKQRLIDFFMRHRGSYEDFLFRDPLDSFASAQSNGVVVGGNKVFQLYRRLYSYSMPIYHFLSTPIMTLTRPSLPSVNLVPGVNCTMGQTSGVNNGLVTIDAGVTTPDGSELFWTGSYEHRVRFDMDEQESELFLQGMWSMSSVKLVLVK